ncbi:pyruvate dehydrogenase E2 component (dihydrolipoamide acetyltransferase) [Halopolyspora algeriensis]|uniref:Dihydrolipoamide acetyltransferase component of pyruvate dehydrogenase complex n=1 Tax=Halopolyspora algeriensis TaxID=1500506 RepID=A0A368VEM8_9ACTN|nr:dihydrolipoamide acetyltransferase family protein [Halopolyspora algeriensis]RCW39717.1 pyruvate dehydrogenase E2 component (dihydrolipoamide acetyltransferase) [Halopolyspora algeriensis]TQM53991.1 pyruvate dehydrogenase E2 component (dihydrolipoamide acetyltransferase) [Halopolyspora algeriensis]
MSAHEFRLPDLGEGLTEAEIVRWLVETGQTVEVDQPVVEVETAKASVEVPTPHGGTITALHGAAGEVIAVGAPLLSVEDGGDETAEAAFDEPGVAAPESGSGNVLVGYGTGNDRKRHSRRRRQTPVATQEPERAQPSRPAVISPVVRKLARDNGIDPATLTGSGKDGLILRSDVQAAIGAATAPTTFTPDRSEPERIPLTGVRGAIAEQLSRSRREIPEATVWVDVDATELLRVRAEINAADAQQPVSVLALLARFCVLGLQRYPALNSTVDTDRSEVLVHPAVHLGVAAQTPRGLLVPVIRDAGRHSSRHLAAELNRTTTAAREGTLSPSDLTGGTFTVNNYGVFGVDGSAAIINHPEAAILGMGRITDRPWAVDGELALRKITQLTLAFDHRVCDGETAGGFLRFVADCVERPTALLGDL